MWSMVSNAADRSKRVRAVTDPLAILRGMSKDFEFAFQCKNYF